MRNILRDTRGATAIEYGLIVALIVIVAVVGIRALGNASSGSLNSTANTVAQHMPSE